MPRKSRSARPSYESFTLFSRLPFELRSQIWKLVIVDCTRIIYLQQHSIPTSSTTQSIIPPRKSQDEAIPSLSGSSSISTATPEPHPQPTAYRSRCPPPPLLSTCSESRAIAQTFYTLAFSSPSCPPTTYISFSNDVLYISYSFLQSAVDFWERTGAFHTDLQADIRKVQHLMIGGVWAPYSTEPWCVDFLNDILGTLRAFAGLYSVTLVDGKHDEEDRDLMVLNESCPYECWEWHDDDDDDDEDEDEEPETTCLRKSDPDYIMDPVQRLLSQNSVLNIESSLRGVFVLLGERDIAPALLSLDSSEARVNMLEM
ncbi:hypothetical protein G7Y89_g11520 [Cudoniella acicularis]|uniref:2EXR domain-containing protein n=1 Tax=Cudoniella acicularis TaxID=354080 RepID=A0A8H4VY79_9HELO|nr:hypothetical protein G7Y89_g11520 [Cudoniella acicularis]